MSHRARLLGLTVFVSVSGYASTLLYRADFSASQGQSCNSFLGCTPSSLSAFSQTFRLDSTALAADGTYDISPSFGLGPFTLQGLGGTFSKSYSVSAKVFGGKVVGLDGSAMESAFFTVAQLSVTRTGTLTPRPDGTFELKGSGFRNWEEYSGTYQIAAIPEAGSLGMVLAGLAWVGTTRLRRG